MSFIRSIECNCCGAKGNETAYGEGFPGWGGVSGVSPNGGVGEYHMCPDCMPKLLEILNALEEEKKKGAA